MYLIIARSQFSPGADGVIEGAPAVGVKYLTTDHFGPLRGPRVQKGPGIGVPLLGVIFQNTNAIRTFTFTVPLPIAAGRKIPACGPCFARMVLEHAGRSGQQQ